jgi:hypothetical protein
MLVIQLLSLQMLSIQLTSTIIPQSLGSLLWSNIPLRLGHKLISNQKLSDCRTSEKRGIEMHMEMRGLDFLLRAFKWSLMDTRTYTISTDQD